MSSVSSPAHLWHSRRIFRCVRRGPAPNGRTRLKPASRRAGVCLAALRARGALPERDPNDNRSDGERALLYKADALDVDPSIRDAVARESGIVQEDPGFVESLLFWKSTNKDDAVVDPANEAERLRRNEALGKKPTDGSTITKQN